MLLHTSMYSFIHTEALFETLRYWTVSKQMVSSWFWKVKAKPWLHTAVQARSWSVWYREKLWLSLWVIVNDKTGFPVRIPISDFQEILPNKLMFENNQLDFVIFSKFVFRKKILLVCMIAFSEIRHFNFYMVFVYFDESNFGPVFPV